MKRAKVRDPLASSPLEKILYGLGDAGGAVLLSFPGSYLTLYLTDSVGMTAAFVGAMMLVCRIFDGISDAFMGVLIDRTRTKWGKARPWFALSILPLAASFIALFCMPQGLSESAQKLYASLVFFLVTVVFYTINNISYHSLLQRFSLSSSDRSSVSAARSVLCIAMVAVFTVVTPLQIINFGGESNPVTWKKLALLWGTISTVCLLITAFGIKEKLPAIRSSAVEDDSPQKNETKGTARKALYNLLHCRYFYLLCGLSLIYFTLSNLRGISFYYVRDVLGSEALMSIIAVISVVPTLIFAPFLPALFRKVGKKRTCLLGLILSGLGGLIILIDTRSIPFAIISQVLRTVGVLPLGTALSTLAGDIADFLQMKTNIRSDGVTTSAYSVGVKIGTGFGAAIVAWSLALGNYDSSLTVQPDSALWAMVSVNSIIPTVLCIIGIVCLAVWNLERYQPEVTDFMEKLQSQKDQSANRRS